jgi:hypothetical protein
VTADGQAGAIHPLSVRAHCIKQEADFGWLMARKRCKWWTNGISEGWHIQTATARAFLFDKSLGLYRQCSGGKLFETVEPGGAGALPIRRFVLNPLWGFNCKLIYQKELNNHGRGGRRASGIALHSTPAQAG